MRKISILGIKTKHLVVAITIIVVICLLILFIFVVHQRNKASYLNLELTEYETVLYEQFAETLDDEILKNLSHLQLIKFLLHSEKEYDFKTEYYLGIWKIKYEPLDSVARLR